MRAPGTASSNPCKNNGAGSDTHTHTQKNNEDLTRNEWRTTTCRAYIAGGVSKV